ncbi:uncharacterized protein LOC120886132 [Ictidomys tridecemlineatus]|uniref:translation initiation factor IF-2-like n=1 Tax=Ictidomys tridecemlineatus TaxID=43179 RepID=UPI001AA0062C|nr:translation initiation factor IF-2-like [Ictidomys tridecemlineatus]
MEKTRWEGTIAVAAGAEVMEQLMFGILITPPRYWPGLFGSRVPGARTPIGEVMGLFSSGGETLGATAESGADRHQCAALPGVSQSAQLLPASPAALSPRRLNCPASKAVHCVLAPAGSPPSPTPAPPILDCPSPHPSASPLSFCQRGSPDSLPFLGVRGAGAPKERPPAGATRGAPGKGRH